MARKERPKGSIGNTNCDLVVDPYTVAKEGKVRLVVNAYFDAKVLVPTAIAVAKVKE